MKSKKLSPAAPFMRWALGLMDCQGVPIVTLEIKQAILEAAEEILRLHRVEDRYRALLKKQKRK